MTFNLGFIGGGNMSSAIVRGILNSNDAHPASNIWVSGPNLNNLKHWQDLGTNVTTKNGDVLFNCDIIVLGVKPNMIDVAIEDCLKTSMGSCKPNVLFVSMLAGINIEILHMKLKTLTSNPRAIRIMPNTPMAVGFGSCLYTPDSSVKPQECLIVEGLLRSCGICERVPESLMDTLGSLTACGPAFIYIVIEALADGAVKMGVPRAMALRHAAQMVMGSGKVVLDSGKHPGQLKDEVCSAGGSTICGVAALENGRIRMGCNISCRPCCCCCIPCLCCDCCADEQRPTVVHHHHPPATHVHHAPTVINQPPPPYR